MISQTKIARDNNRPAIRRRKGLYRSTSLSGAVTSSPLVLLAVTRQRPAPLALSYCENQWRIKPLSHKRNILNSSNSFYINNWIINWVNTLDQNPERVRVLYGTAWRTSRSGPAILTPSIGTSRCGACYRTTVASAPPTQSRIQILNQSDNYLEPFWFTEA